MEPAASRLERNWRVLPAAHRRITGLLGGFGITGQTLDGGPSMFGQVGTTLLFALEGGAIVGGHHEIGVELTPFFTANPIP